MTIEEYRNKLVQAQGGGSSSAPSGMSGYRETLAQSTPENGLAKVYQEINLGYSGITSGIQAGDTRATQSALARVRRNIEALRHYGNLLKDERILQDVQSAQASYQEAWLKYDGMKRQKAAEASPIASGLKTYDGTGGQLGQTLVGVDTEYMAGNVGDKWKSYTEAEDFGEWAAKGAAIQNPTLAEAENAGSLFGKRIGGADIGNIVTYSRDNWEKIAMGEANGSSMQGRSIYKYMSGAEVSLYNYLLAKEGTAKAQEYLDELEETLNLRMGGGQAKRITGIENGVGRAAALGLYALDAGTDQAVSGLRQYITKENLPTSPMQYGSQMIGEQLEGFGKEAYHAVQVVGNMLPSIAVGMLNPAAGSATMGVSAAGNAYGQALDEGYSEGQARLYGTLVGGAEGALQYLLGGLDKLGGISASGILSKVSMIDNAFLRIAAKLGVSLGSEITEEEIQLWLEPAIRTIVLGDEYTAPTIQEMLETAVVTALSTGMLEGGGTVASDVAEGRIYKDVYGGAERDLVEEGLDIDPQNTYAQKLQAQLNRGKNLSGHQIMNLVQQNEAGNIRQDKADIQGAATARLAELGETGDIHALGAALAKQAAGEKLSRMERNLIANSTYGQRVANELNADNIRSGEYDSGWAEKIGTSRINAVEYGRGIAEDGTDVLNHRTPESVTNAPETGTNAPKTVSESPAAELAGTEETLATAPEAVVSKMETSPEGDLMAREVENITDIRGMSDEAAMRYWGTEFTRIQMEITKAYANGDTEAAGVYEELNRLMGEAAVQGGGNIQAITAYLKGAIHGSNISDGAGRRNAGERAGIEAGGMGSQQDRSDPGRESIRRGNGQAADGAVWESARDLGIPEGSEEKIIRRVSERTWTAEMKSAASEAAELGYSLEYVNGSITVRNPVSGKNQRTNGIIFGQRIVVQADHRLYSAEQLARHEMFHARLAEDPALREEIARAFVERHGLQEVRSITERYANGYGFIYGVVTDGMSADEIAALDMQYLEEFICDAYAGINRAFMGGGNKAAQYGDIVLNIAESRIGMGNGSGGMPGARYSQDAEISEEEYTGPKLRSDYPGLTEYDRYLEGRKETRAEQDRPAMEADTIADREQSKELDILDPRNLARYRGEVYLTLNGEMPSHKSILVGHTPDILVRYGALDAPLYMPQKAVKKAVFDDSVKGGKHGLGEGVIYDLPGELADPIAITGNTTTHKAADDRSIIVWTRWASENGDPIIVPIRIDISAEQGERANNINTVFDVYDEAYREGLLVGENILYTKNNESIEQLLAQWREVPKWAADDAFTSSIREYEEKVNAASKNPTESAKWSADDAGKAPEEMSAAELRRAVRGDQSLLEAYAQIERTGGLTTEARRERDAVASRLVKERELLKRKNEEFSAEKQNARERARARTVPVRAKTDFRKEMLDIFSAQSGMRQELGTMVDRFAEDTLSRGAVSYQDRQRLIDRLYEAGAMTMEADEYARDIRANIAGTRVYVDERTRAEIGEAEYSAFRREAFGVGVILTSDKNDYGVNRVYGRLQEQFPGKFRLDVDDPKGMLDEIVAAAREGKAESVSLVEMMSRVEHDTGWTVADQMEAMERKVDAAIDKFIEKAKLETDLRARSAVQMAQEREERRKTMERQAESRNLREMQQKTMKALQWLKKNERRMPAEVKAQAQELLDGLDLYAISLADEMRWSGKHQATWRDLADMYQNAREHDPNFLPSKELEMIWSRVNEKKVGELDLDALETLYRAASALRTEFYNRNNVINDEEHRLFSEAYHDSVGEIRTSGGKGKLGKFFNAEQLTPVNVLQMMGGWRRNGRFFSFARMLESGERGYKEYVVDANRVLQEFIEEHQAWIKKADGQGKDAIWYEVEVPELLELHMGDKPIFGETKKVYMTPAQKVHLYLESMNHQNLRHMAGGRTFVDRALYEQGKRTEAMAQGTTIRLAPETVKKLVSNLTEEEMALAKVLQQYYNQFASERINAVSNPLYGYDKAVTRDYAPIFSNRNYTKTEPGVYDMTAEGVGHMKGREQYSKNPSYNISAFDAFQRHVEQTARFVGYSIPVRNMNTLMNWRVQGSSMRDEITHVWGEEGASYIENYIKKLQSPVFQEKSIIQKAAGKLLSNYISGVFAANPSVVLKQLLSYPMAGSVLGFGNMPTPAQIARADTELMVKYTPELEYRRMGYATPELAQLKDNPNWTQTNKVTRFIFGGGAITWTDAGAARAIWPWAENYVRKNFPDLEVGTQEQIDAGQSPFYRKVAEVYNDAVTNTQSMADISHRPTIMNHDDAITRAFTMFRSDAAQAYNTVRRLSGELARATKDGDKASARTVRASLAAGVSAVILSQLGGEAINFLMALWKNKAKWYRDDEDELTAQSVGREYLSGLMESMAGLVFGGEQVMQVILALINREDWSFTNGIEVPGMEQLNDFIDVTLEAASGMTEIVDGAFDLVKNGGDLEKYLKRHSGDILGIIKDTAITMAQYLGGVPTANIEKYLLGTVRWISPELGAAYDSLFTTPTKDSLSGLKGEDLAATVGDVLAIRDIQADDGTSAELARLYEAGQKGGVPGTVAETFAVNGENFTMNATQLQEYERVYAEAIGDSLDALVESDAYIEADDETRAKMLERLYTYATQTAKRAVAPEYQGDTWTRNAAAAEDEGVPLSAYAALQAQGLSRNADKIDYIDGMRLTDDQKGMLYYYAVATDARKEDADAMMDTGMGWDTMYETMKEYMDIDAMEGVTASEKAATFKTWAYNNLSSAQTNAAVENLTFSTGMKASTTTYDKLMASGLSANDALAVTTAWNNLEPEEGRSTVSDLQKMNAIVTTLRTPATQMEALSSMLDDANRWKLSRAANYDITAEDYVEFKNTLEDYYDYDPEGSVGALSQDEVTAAIQSMAWLNISQKAVLWQIQTMGKDGKNNPFSTAIGLDVYNAYQDWKESGEEVKTSGTAGSSAVEPVGWTGNYPGLQLPVW